MARTHLLAGSVERIARLFGKWVVKRCNDSNSKCASQHPYFIHAVVSRIREGRKDRRSAAFRNAFSPRCRPSCNKDRKGRSRSLSCKTEGSSYHQSIRDFQPRTDNNENGVTWCVKHRSIRLSILLLEKKKLAFAISLILSLSRKRNVIFIRFEEENFLSRIWNDILESNIWRTSCLPNLRCVHAALLRNSNWHARYGYATWMQTKH